MLKQSYSLESLILNSFGIGTKLLTAAAHYYSQTKPLPTLITQKTITNQNTFIHFKNSTPVLKTPPSLFQIFDSATRSYKSFEFISAASYKAKNIQKPHIGTYLSIQSGEDSFFVRPDAMGIADGVGGWAGYKNANPSLYSRKLMHYISAELGKYDLNDENNLSMNSVGDFNTIQPQDLLKTSYQLVTKDSIEMKFVGSSTAIIALLRDDELRVANLGDCGLMIIRNQEILFRTEEQQHGFNFPYQLGTGSSDQPEDSSLFSIKMHEGDLVILGSDGIFDNLFDEEILSIVKTIQNGRKSLSIDPKVISDVLLSRAREIGQSKSHDTPFSSRAAKQGLFYHGLFYGWFLLGGKMDDMTVLVGIVRLTEDSPDRR